MPPSNIKLTALRLAERMRMSRWNTKPLTTRDREASKLATQIGGWSVTFNGGSSDSLKNCQRLYCHLKEQCCVFRKVGAVRPPDWGRPY